MVRWGCGIGWGEEQLKLNPALASIAQAWRQPGGTDEGLDRAVAEVAIHRIYSRIALPFPVVRWWQSPVAMILAHEVHSLGESGARSLYGGAVFDASVELGLWLHGRNHPIGRPVGLRACPCSNQAGRGRVDDCPKHRILIERAVSAAKVEEAGMLATTASPLWQSRGIELLIREAFSLAMEPTYHREQDLGRTKDRQVFGPTVAVWPGTTVGEVVRWQFISQLTGTKWDGSCLFAYADLIRNSSLAILRENECWLAQRPTFVSFNADGEIHNSKAAAVRYADGTELYVHRGGLLPKTFVVSPELMSLDLIDSLEAQPLRRQKLIELYGIENYLTDRNAIAEMRTDTATLWRLQAGEQGELRILERYEELRMMSGPGRTYYELPVSVSTLGAALAFAEDPDDVCRLVIEN